LRIAKHFLWKPTSGRFDRIYGSDESGDADRTLLISCVEQIAIP
jgi:hypothetical protein